jgi:UPF0042 nucleotide-binding protein
MILVVSFAYRNGIPNDFLGCIIDARVFDNPSASPRMLRQNGLSKEYQALFFAKPHNKEAMLEAISFARNQVEKNNETVIGVGCELGKFRSVAVAEKISADLKKRGHKVDTVHSTMEVLRLL